MRSTPSPSAAASACRRQDHAPGPEVKALGHARQCRKEDVQFAANVVPLAGCEPGDHSILPLAHAHNVARRNLGAQSWMRRKQPAVAPQRWPTVATAPLSGSWDSIRWSSSLWRLLPRLSGRRHNSSKIRPFWPDFGQAVPSEACGSRLNGPGVRRVFYRTLSYAGIQHRAGDEIIS